MTPVSQNDHLTAAAWAAREKTGKESRQKRSIQDINS